MTPTYDQQQGISLIEAWQNLNPKADLFERRPVAGVPNALFTTKEEAQAFAKTYGWDASHEVVQMGDRWLLRPMECVA